MLPAPRRKGVARLNLRSARDGALAVVAGAVAPLLVLGAWSAARAATHGPTERIAAFLAPHASRAARLDPATLALDAVAGALVGVVVAMLVARFTRSRRWLLWLLFAAAFLAALAALGPGPGPGSGRLLLTRLAEGSLVVVGAGLGFFLAGRGPAAAAR